MAMTIFDALAEAQAKLAVPKGRKNDFGGYNYRKAEDIIGAYRGCAIPGASLVLTDRLEEVGGQIFVVSTARLSVGDQSVMAEGAAMHALSKKGMDASQITGSASSYARKYALQGLFALDDGDADPDQRDNRTENGNAPSEDAVLRDKMMAGLNDRGASLAEHPKFKSELETLRGMNPQAAAEIEVRIEQMKEAA